MALNKIKTIEIDGTTYALPEMSNTDIAKITGFLLLLSRIEYTYDSDYKTRMDYLDGSCARVQLGTMEVYKDKITAYLIRDTYNKALAEKKASE